MQLVLSSTKAGFKPSISTLNRNKLATKSLRSRSYLSIVRAEAEGIPEADELENPESESARKKAEADRLRAAEKFMTVGTGEAECKSCNYVYTPKLGDPEYPVAPGVKFQQLPEDWQCPVCGAEKKMFAPRERTVAGFAENQGYGLGTNSMTGEQKQGLIYGSLAFFFLLFLLGYTMN